MAGSRGTTTIQRKATQRDALRGSRYRSGHHEARRPATVSGLMRLKRSVAVKLTPVGIAPDRLQTLRRHHPCTTTGRPSPIFTVITSADQR